MFQSHWDRVPEDAQIYIYEFDPTHRLKLNRVLRQMIRMFWRRPENKWAGFIRFN